MGDMRWSASRPPTLFFPTCRCGAGAGWQRQELYSLGFSLARARHDAMKVAYDKSGSEPWGVRVESKLAFGHLLVWGISK